MGGPPPTRPGRRLRAMASSSSSGPAPWAPPRGLAPEKCFLPRTIDFVLAAVSSSSSSGPGHDAGESGAAADPTVPAYYLYPRDRLLGLCSQRTPRQVGRGLRNAGNTCFFNSVLQVLLHTQPLQSFLLSGEHCAGCQANGDGSFCALCLFEGHGREALDIGKAPVHPKALLKRLKELGGRGMHLGRQQDAHEFLRHFLDACHRSALRPVKEKNGEVPLAVQRTTLVHQLFGGYLRSQVVCLVCHNESNTFDPFLDLSLEVKNAPTLEKALEGFMKSEKLTGKNSYRCKRCMTLVEATKRFVIHKTPPLMTFQLKRFDYTQGFRGKIIKNVAFGTSLDLSRFTSTPESEAKYRLYAVIVHSGHSARSGHYFAFARHATGTWYHFDDEDVKVVAEQTVLRQQAYLLFYELESSMVPQAVPASSSSAKAPSVAASNGSASLNALNGTSDAASNGSASLNGLNSTSAAASNGRSAEPALLSTPVVLVNGNKPAKVSSASSPDTRPVVAASTGSAADTAKSAVVVAETAVTARGPLPLLPLASATSQAASNGGVAESIARPMGRGRSGLKRLRLLHVLKSNASAKRRKLACSERGDVLHINGAVAAPSGAVEEGKKSRKSKRKARTEPPEPPPRAAKAVREQTTDERAWKASSYKTQFGLAEVNRWDDNDAVPTAFVEAQRKLQPEVQRRDEHDAEYDAGKRKHKPKKQKAAFEGKTAFDLEETRRRKQKAGGGMRPGGKGKGKGKGKNKGKGKGKGKGEGKGKGQGGGSGGKGGDFGSLSWPRQS